MDRVRRKRAMIIVKVVRSLREAINLNSFSDEIHGLPSTARFINMLVTMLV